jgi:hypothetical protein
MSDVLRADWSNAVAMCPKKTPKEYIVPNAATPLAKHAATTTQP